MAIVKLNPDAQPPIQRTVPGTIEAPAKSIFTSLVPEAKITSLLKHVEGYPWTVNFYGQLLNKNNTLENFDPTTPNLTAPYYKISNLILQVSSPLSSSYDQATGITSITGSAVTPYSITPNVGDVFIAQVDNGEDAIFHITTVTRKTFRKDTLYEISYTLYAYTSNSPEFIVKLQERVNDEYFFNKDTNFFNRDILIKPSVQEAIDTLKVFVRQSQEYYFSTFSQKRTGSILIPGIPYTLYDPLLVDFISKTVVYDRLIGTSFQQHSYISKEIDQPSIFTAILTRNVTNLKIANRTYGFLPTGLLINSSRLGTAYHTGIDYILHPTNPDIRAQIKDQDFPARSEYIETMKTLKNYNFTNTQVVKTTNNNQSFDTLLLHHLFEEDYYVVSKNFYDYLQDHSNYAQVSYVELLIYKFIHQQAISKEDIALVVNNYQDWSLLHQLYLLPVLWVMVKTV